MVDEMADLTEKLDALEHKLHSSVGDVLELARQTPPAGTPAWIALMASVGVEPLGLRQREQALRTGFQFHRGALPVEVRMVLERIRDDVSTRSRTVAEPADVLTGETARAYVESFQRRLDELVETRLQDYVDAIKPAASVNAIFANALASTKKFTAEGSGSQTKTCDCCGAGRPADTDLRTCAFCGTPFFRQ